MNEPTSHEINPFSIRRATILHADTVRYRVYTSPTDFVMVVAENALLALRVAGIATPHKIVRDFPALESFLEDGTLVPETAEATFLLAQQENKTVTAELPSAEDADADADAPFVPITLTDLQSKNSHRQRILPPEMVQEIIAQHAAQSMPAPESPPVPSPPPPPATENAEAVDVPPTAPAAAIVEAAREPAPQVETEAEPMLSPHEKITQLADQLLPPAAPVADTLTPEEVEKLLNG